MLVGDEMRYLGLDLGTKTLGVAITDTTGLIARPLTVIRFPKEDYNLALNKLQSILAEYTIAKIALGFPKNMDGTEGFASARSLKFKEMLENITDIPIILVDERLTTVMAENILLEANISRKRRKSVIDGVAAVLILETFIKMEEKNE